MGSTSPAAGAIQLGQALTHEGKAQAQEGRVVPVDCTACKRVGIEFRSGASVGWSRGSTDGGGRRCSSACCTPPTSPSNSPATPPFGPESVWEHPATTASEAGEKNGIPTFRPPWHRPPVLAQTHRLRAQAHPRLLREPQR